MDYDKIKTIYDEIAKDAEQDTIEFDGRIFNGRSVAEMMGKQNAMIAGLAKINIILVERLKVIDKVI